MNRDRDEKPKRKPNLRAQRHNREVRQSNKSKARGELETLEQRVRDEAPESGSVFPIGTGPVKFSDLPVSQATLRGLNKASYENMTEIQRTSIPHSLVGRDVLGAAKTGSGKTIAFLIPILEKLYRAQWTAYDGIGALVITPTRELALQIFDVLRKIGKFHTLSAGLVIGGKDLKTERDLISHMNILICTPGRLLQHMDETSGFECTNLQILVLDEADRILDLGFSKSMNAIIQNLPAQRQTLLFSATQTKSVQDLARLSLKDAEYVSIYKESVVDTPQKLVQNYLVCPLQDKIDMLYSFIKTHLKAKTIVFMSTCKQVRFMYECFCKMRPGIPVLCLHGKMKQHRRLEVYYDFCDKNAAVIFATDIAARGLDFPAVDWVVQLDCPEDLATYIHRVGRTARYQSGGKALLFLVPSEEKGMAKLFEQGKIPIKKILTNPTRRLTTLTALQQYVAEDPEFKYLAQKAFVSYMRSIYLMNNKEIFNIQSLPAAEYSLSLGLIGTPKIKFGAKIDVPGISGAGKSQTKKFESDSESDDNKEEPIAKSDARTAKKPAVHEKSDEESSNEEEDEKDQAKTKENDDEDDEEDDDEDEDDEDDEDDEKEGKKTRLKTRVDRLYNRKNATIYSDSYKSMRENTNEDDDGDDLLVVKRVDHELDEDIAKLRDIASKKSMRKIKADGRANSNRIKFDDEGNVITEFDEIGERAEKVVAPQKLEKVPDFLENLKEKMTEQDKLDRLRERERVREKHKKERLKTKLRNQNASEDGAGTAVLGTADDYEDDESEDEDDGSDEEDNRSGEESGDDEDNEDNEDDEEDEDEEEEGKHQKSKSSSNLAGSKRKELSEKPESVYPNQRRRVSAAPEKAEISLEDMEKLSMMLLNKK